MWIRVRVGAAIVAALVAAVGVRGQALPATPILVVVNNASPNPFGAYLPEILRAEGVNTFTVVQLSALDAPTLAGAALTVLAETPLTAPQATLFINYVGAGGRLVAMRPDAQLASILGIAPAAGTTTDGYALIDQAGPGAGLQNVTLPFKGVADHFDLAGGTSVAALYSTRTLSAGRPAVVRHNGTAAWAFDLARSTAYARQGDPAFAGLDRDGLVGYRTNDIFFQTIDLERVGVPHADVQMRVFSRVIGELLADSQPLPKLWYFPGASRTIVIPTGDSHTSAPAPYAALITAVENAGAHISLYLSRFLDLSGSPVATWVANGHEVGMHPFFTPEGFANNFPAGYTQAATWFQGFVPVPPGPGVRHHSLEWGGWVDPVSVMPGFGVRMDLSYYAWGPVLDHPSQSSQAHGYLTGSGLPMRFVSGAGQVLPVYQQVTSLVDEQLLTGVYTEGLTTQQALAVSRQLIDDSQAGGYSAIATQFHVDYYQFGQVQPWVDGTLAYAKGLQIPMWTAERWLRFVEARAQTGIANLAWSPGTGQLAFSVAVPAGADPQSVMLPQTFAGRVFSGVTLDAQTVAPTLMAINGQLNQVLQVAPLPGGGPRQILVSYAVPASLPTLAINDVSVIEGNSGTAVAGLTVTLSAPSATDVTVVYGTSNGTATAGADYQATSGTLTFLAGTTSRPLPVTILGDTNKEPNETVVVTLTNPVGATFGDDTGVVTILDDEPNPTSWTNTTAADFTGCSVLSGTRVGATGDVRLTGVFRDDFNAGSLDPMWISGSWVGPPYVPVPAGGVLSLGNADGAFVRSTGLVSATTLEVRARFTAAPFQGIGIADDTLTTHFALFSTRNTGTNLWARTDPGTGEIQTDLGPVPTGFHVYGLERIAQGATELFRYTIDGAVVADHTVPAAQIPAARYIFLTHNGGATPTLDVDSVDAAPLFTTPGTFDSCTIDAILPVTWNLLSWTATVPGTSGLVARTRSSLDSVTWSAWSAPIGASGSPITSPAGRYLQYRLELSTSDPASGPIVQSVTVTAIGPPPPAVSIGNTTVAEGPGATAAFTVSLSAANLQTVSVIYATSSGTATSGLDFTAGSGTVTFVPGVTTQTVNIAVTDDALDENDETFAVTLASPVNGTLGAAVGTGTITDNDAPPALSVAGVTVVEGNSGQANAVFAVTLSAMSGKTITVSYATANGTATAGVDYAAASGQVTFVPGVAQRSIAVAVNGDHLVEPSETFTVALSSPSNATIAVGQATGVITDDDTLPTSVADTFSTSFNTPLSVPAPGVLSNDDAHGAPGLTAQLVSDVIHGALSLGVDGSVSYTPTDGFIGTDGFTYRSSSAAGSGATVSVTLTVTAPTVVQPPQQLRVSETKGNLITFRWKAPAVGPVPTGYLIEGGMLPGQTFASLATPHTFPIFSVVAPAGSIYVRLRALGTGGPSQVSNELLIHVGVPMAPSALAAPLVTVQGATVNLAWAPTFAGGPLESVVLDVAGSATTSLPLPALEHVAFAGVPGGTYTVSLRAVNRAGSSPASPPVTLTVPAACTGAPSAPTNLLAYAFGGTTFAVWDIAITGEAPTGYLVSVPGIGSLTTSQRTASGVLPAGTYTVSVQAVGVCGLSAPASQTLTVP